jgi:dihydroflavonol-4-reductase
MVLVTGATGHIGNVLVRQLLSRGEEVRALIHRDETITTLDGLKVEMVKGDVCNPDSFLRAFMGIDIVYHLAGRISILPGQDRLLHQVNVVGTQNIIKACIKTGVKRLVYTSSIHAIEEPPPGTIIDETCPCNPDKVPKGYGRSKAQATLAVLRGVEQGLNAVIVCPTGVTGPYDYKISEIGQLIIDFANRNLKAYIDGAYDFIDVRDVATGIILAGKKGSSGECYILSGEQITVYGLMLMLQELTGVKAPSLRVPVWLARIVAKVTPLYYYLTITKPRFTTHSIDVLRSNSLISSEKARRELGFSTRPIRESIADAILWFKEKGYISIPPMPQSERSS